MLHRAFLSSLPGLSASHSSLPLPLSLFFSPILLSPSLPRLHRGELAALRLSHAHAGGRACVRAVRHGKNARAMLSRRVRHRTPREGSQPAADERIRACAYPKYHRAREKKIGDRARARARTHERTHARTSAGALAG